MNVGERFSITIFGKGTTPLMKAAENNKVKTVKKILNTDCNIDESDINGYTALIYAVCCGHYDIVKLLLQNGADVNAIDNDGWTPLSYAVNEGHGELVLLLLKNGGTMKKTVFKHIFQSNKQF